MYENFTGGKGVSIGTIPMLLCAISGEPDIVCWEAVVLLGVQNMTVQQFRSCVVQETFASRACLMRAARSAASCVNASQPLPSGSLVSS